MTSKVDVNPIVQDTIGKISGAAATSPNVNTFFRTAGVYIGSMVVGIVLLIAGQLVSEGNYLTLAILILVSFILLFMLMIGLEILKNKYGINVYGALGSLVSDASATATQTQVNNTTTVPVANVKVMMAIFGGVQYTFTNNPATDEDGVYFADVNYKNGQTGAITVTSTAFIPNFDAYKAKGTVKVVDSPAGLPVLFMYADGHVAEDAQAKYNRLSKTLETMTVNPTADNNAPILADQAAFKAKAVDVINAMAAKQPIYFNGNFYASVLGNQYDEIIYPYLSQIAKETGRDYTTFINEEHKLLCGN